MAILGAVIPSHKEPTPPVGDGSSASWAIWNGALKAYKLDQNGNIPLVPATIPSVTETATPTPVTPTTTPLPVGYPDERSFNDTDPSTRRPVWNAGRVLGYTDPVANLAGAAPAAAATPAANAAPITVWPGRRMVWADGTGPGVPLNRQDFMPDTDTCTGTTTSGQCFYDLMVNMSLKPAVPGDVTTAIRTVQFLRGGKTTGGSRDEILNDLGTYGTVNPNTTYSYLYQDEIPPGNPASAQTDGAADPKYYSHKLGDIFHSEAALLLPPKYFQYTSADLNPRTGACGSLYTDCSYNTFKDLHSKRRKVVFVGANDGFLHAFDAGVFDRDDDPGQVGPTADHPFNDTFDLGTGREIFAYAPKSIMPTTPDALGFPSLLNYPPKVQYFVDGSPVLADVFIDTAHAGTPDSSNRTWKTILVSGLRQGGRSYFALDVTQPDQVDSDGSKSASDKDSAPDCLDGGGTCSAAYPTVLWEMTDATLPAMGETWSRPVVGRIHIASGAGFDDRYVAIFGGGFDPSYVTDGSEVPAGNTSIRGRGIYVVSVETGKVLYKATQGTNGSGDPVEFAPMPAPPAVADSGDDGYLDVAYIGDLNGRMWRLDLTSAECASCGNSNETLTFAHPPFLLYDALTSDKPVQPIFLDAGVIYISGGPTPVLGVGFGTGYRAELLRANPNLNRFFYVIDPGTRTRTFYDTDLVNITPNCPSAPIPGEPACVSTPGTGPAATRACSDDDDSKDCGYFLDFATADEKAISTVFSTLGNLSVVTFHPQDTDVKCGNGTSYRYSFFYSTGRGAYNLDPSVSGTTNMSDYRENLGQGLASASQSQSPSGDMIDTVVFSGGGIYQKNTAATLKTLSQSWKEQ